MCSLLISELEDVYRQLMDAFKRNDPMPWIERLAPQFKLTLFNGTVQDRDWVVDYVRNNAKAFTVQELLMKITDIELLPSSEKVVATVEQVSSRTFRDEDGQSHTLDVGAIQLETWLKTPYGWQLLGVKEHKLLYLKKDGK